MYLYYDPKVIKKIQLAKLDYIIFSYGITCCHYEKEIKFGAKSLHFITDFYSVGV
jgi:hypothetical protein